MRRVIFVALVGFFSLCFADQPLSIHLKLGKDTLALAEPTLLTVEVRNVSDAVQYIGPHHVNLFSGFGLYLITPDGQCLEHSYRVQIHGDYIPGAKVYYPLQKDSLITEYKEIWWANFLARDGSQPHANMMPGKYKLYSRYRNGTSDTVEFIFLPADTAHHNVLIALDSLGKQPYHKRDSVKFNYIAESQTPYSEAALVPQMLFKYDYDSLERNKSRFVGTYPNSAFIPYILEHQTMLYVSILPITISKNYIDSKRHYDDKSDSLFAELEKVDPRNFYLINRRENDRFMSSTEVGEAKEKAEALNLEEKLEY